MRFTPLIGQSQFSIVDATLREVATGLAEAGDFLFASTTNCWIRQGTAKLVTCATQANMADTDFITITVATVAGVTSTKVYEFDKAGNGVTAGRVQVNISADTTAATVAARLKTAIEANQTMLRVVDPTNGTLQIDLPDSRSLTITEDVAHASFTVAAGVVQATAAAGSMFVPLGVQLLFKGKYGGQLSAIRATADGNASVTPVSVE